MVYGSAAPLCPSMPMRLVSKEGRLPSEVAPSRGVASEGLSTISLVLVHKTIGTNSEAGISSELVDPRAAHCLDRPESRWQKPSHSATAVLVSRLGRALLHALIPNRLHRLAMYTRSMLPSSHGNFYELYAIAAGALGGFSRRGAEGSIVGVVLGTILLQVLQNLVNLLGIPSSLNFAVSRSVILIGVLADLEYADLHERRERLRRLAAERLTPRKRTNHRPGTESSQLARGTGIHRTHQG